MKYFTVDIGQSGAMAMTAAIAVAPTAGRPCTRYDDTCAQFPL
jgi:hypothetical protein